MEGVCIGCDKGVGHGPLELRQVRQEGQPLGQRVLLKERGEAVTGTPQVVRARQVSRDVAGGERTERALSEDAPQSRVVVLEGLDQRSRMYDPAWLTG